MKLFEEADRFDRELEWVAEPPTRSSGRGENQPWTALFVAAARHPGEWVQIPWPVSSPGTTKSRIKGGDFAGIKAGQFNAITRSGTMWISYVEDAS